MKTRKPPTQRQVIAVEAAARKAWARGFPTLNFPYDLDVRFGRLANEALRGIDSDFIRHEFERLIAQVRWIRRAGEDMVRYRQEYGRGLKRRFRR